MRGFLRETAEDLYEKYGEGISSLSVLFPSRRARLFFIDALRSIVQRPLWQPEWLTVDDLMTEVSGLRTGDRVRLITELYKVYSDFHREPFDKFYFWGEMLLTDFDTIDKYLIDADMLFRNLSDIKELEADVSYLTPDQLKIVTFWMSFAKGGELTDEKRKFLSIWQSLGPVYHRFRERLLQMGIAYPGMVQRAAAERLAAGDFVFTKRRHYVVAGFNALTECEKKLFRYLSTAAEVEFYWDYDDYYADNPDQEAGMFVRENLRMFPPSGRIGHDHLRHAKELRAISAVSNAVQCKHAAALLDEFARDGVLGKETAVVLTDENLLLPLLYALPESAGTVNVTMGFPLRQSMAYTFVERLIELQGHRRSHRGREAFYHTDVTGLLSHPYLSESNRERIAELQADMLRDRRISVEASVLAVDELLSLVFSPVSGWRELSDYLIDVVSAVARKPYEGDDARRRVEFLAVIAENLSKLRNSLDECEVDIDTPVYTSLLRRHLQTLRIPYEGEPLEGVQVMGILETRNLDFRNVILLSMNDDNFPGNLDTQASFVPYNLRAAYGLPTPEHHEGVSAYYFYRLIQRAERVAMLYCSHADDKTTGEPSRYIRQLEYESGFPILRAEVGVDVNLPENGPIEVAKEGVVLRRLERFLAADDPAGLSPTAFARYTACPLRFYFASVARLKTTDEIADEVDNPMFGTILHAAVQNLYSRIIGVEHPSEQLRAMIREKQVEQAVTQAVNEVYLHDPAASDDDYTGSVLLVRDIVTRYIRGGVIPYDAAHEGFCVEGVEEPVECRFPIDGVRSVRFAGVADRIDRLKGDTLRVVDYKTGREHLEFKGVEALFEGEERYKLGNILQTLLYAMMLRRSRGCDVLPSLYYVRAMNRDGYVPLLTDKALQITGAKYSLYREAFEEVLRRTLCELFDPAVPFRQCENKDTCQYCDFREICKRG